jgi:hypothetical protein
MNKLEFCSVAIGKDKDVLLKISNAFNKGKIIKNLDFSKPSFF